MTDHLAIAERLFAAITAGDVAAVRALYAPDAQIWHNTDGAVQSAEENLAVLQWVTTHIAQLRYEDVRRAATADGFVQQHVLRGTVGAVAIAIPACIVTTIQGGRITRLDEYLDSAHVKPLLAAARE
ncbi:MAG: nuclear transport factor 2 family protein [Deltaproteobacteria bacterium]|nr:nuclear transport factor 2 family protein [Deltaproteobacteria bacterium]